MGRYVVAKDGAAELVDTSLHDFLLQSPRGAYTVMRTVDLCRKIVCFDDHVLRLSSSTDAMLQTQLDPAPLAQQILHSIRRGIDLLDLPGENLTIAVLIPTEDHDGDAPVPIWVHLSTFHTWHTPSVMVEAMRASRKQFGTTKDSLWAKMRQDLIRAKHADANEVVIIDDDDHLLEGLSSNVYVVDRQGQIQTAAVSDGIVAGTIREILLQACKANGIGVVEMAPRWSDRFEWQGAFLTSTSRLVLPIHEIVDSVTGGDPLSFAPILEMIRTCGDLVEADIDRHCRRIYDVDDAMIV